jgi:hypothetical protein
MVDVALIGGGMEAVCFGVGEAGGLVGHDACVLVPVDAAVLG